MNTKLLHSVLLMLFPVVLHAQYFGERVLEKSFEQTEFFFLPSYINPWGVRGFSTAAPGLINDPLLNLQVNPAFLHTDSLSRNYFYVDLRSKREIFEVNPYGYYWLGYARLAVYDGGYIPYGRFYVTTRNELTPLVSAALLSRPLGEGNPRFFFGATYQLIFQDEKYYSIPQDIYRSVFGYDYLGTRTLADTDVPIVDKYSGTDNMNHTGHFGALYAGYDVNDDLQLGVRFARAMFERSGSFGSKNFWEYFYGSQSTSVWYNMESRSQDYQHWDFSAGVNYRLTETTLAGLTAGYLTGTVLQELTRLDTSLYVYGQPFTGTHWSYSRRLASTLYNWDHKGKTYFAGLNFTTHLNPSQTMNIFYRYTTQDIDLNLTGTIADSSIYSYQYRYDTTSYRSDWRYLVSDARWGGGTRKGLFHQALVALRWDLENSMQLTYGLSYEYRTSETQTTEAVLAGRSSMSSYGYSYYNATEEDKTLRWGFTTQVLTIQIPIMLRWKFTDKIEGLFGLNRRMVRWQTEEVTLAIFKYRNEVSGSVSNRKTNFGERYTSPKETVSTVETIFIGGITFAPSKLFNVRLLVVPTKTERPYQDPKTDHQWWIGLTMHP